MERAKPGVDIVSNFERSSHGASRSETLCNVILNELSASPRGLIPRSLIPLSAFVRGT